MKFLYLLLTLILLPFAALSWLLNRLITPFRRSSSSGMLRVKEQGKRVIYSPYFEYESYFEDTSLLLKVVIHLSNRGIDPKLQAPLTKEASEARKRTLLFREATVFMINQGDSPIEVTPKFLELEEQSITKLDDQPQLIASGHYYESEPVMAKDIRFKLHYRLKIIIEHEEKLYESVGEAKRLTLDALEQKYQKEPDELAAN